MSAGIFARVIGPQEFALGLSQLGIDGSNPSPSSRESGEIVGSATLAERGRCFTAPRLFIWGISISRAPLQAWAATCLRRHYLNQDLATIWLDK